MLVQLHQRFDDGHMKCIAQRDAEKDDIDVWIRKIVKENPLPEHAMWQLETEASEYFIKSFQGGL